VVPSVDIRKDLRRRFSTLGESAVEWAIRLCGWSAILFVFAIFLFVFREGAPVLFRELDLKEFFTSVNWRPDSTIRPQFGILALLAGTASVTALAMAISVPAGFASAIFISEFCGPKAREALKIIIELLAAIPSVVWGFIGYMVLNPVIIWTTGAPIGINILNGGIILALMSVPIIMSVGEDALKAVPDSYREAALALGASRWQLTPGSSCPPQGTGFWPRHC
jgi:phosphate transport system permease protein